MRSLTALWRGLVEEKAGWLTRWTLGPLLATLAWPYGWTQRLRSQVYARGWAPVKRLRCRVLSVGNLTLGGTGKTPLVEAIATLLRTHGYRVAVLSRGYGRRCQKPITVVSDGEKRLVSPEVAGDEPFLLAEHLPGVPVLVGNDRYITGMHAVERFGVEVVVLDDGFQHMQLARDLDILLLDAARPLGNGRLFPRGDLRELPSALSRADLIVFTRWEPGTLVLLSPLRLPHPVPPLFCSQHEPADLRVLQDGGTLPLASLKDRRILAFCGIGAPESFRRTLNRLGATVVAFLSFPDHHPYTQPELDDLARTAAAHGAEALVTTEKDGIRLRRLLPLPWQVWELRIRATIMGQGPAWEACLLRALEGHPH
ncbi:MAG: tetraacyldisaccharide 4'-kinase [Nitrospinae bacterium]|nr:tetraacyldisaccharide 4'-kinase [Nitrospinota bacterium]